MLLPLRLLMLNNIFDAHAHYDDKWFDEDRDDLLSSMPGNGVCGIVNASVDLTTARTAIAYAEKYDFMYACTGIHPENLEGLQDDYLEHRRGRYGENQRDGDLRRQRISARLR